MKRTSKPTQLGKLPKTINFDKIVLDRIERVSFKEGIKVSSLINMVCRRAFLEDKEFFRAMARHHHMEFQKYIYLRDECEEVGSNGCGQWTYESTWDSR